MYHIYPGLAQECFLQALKHLKTSVSSTALKPLVYIVIVDSVGYFCLRFFAERFTLIDLEGAPPVVDLRDFGNTDTAKKGLYHIAFKKKKNLGKKR